MHKTLLKQHTDCHNHAPDAPETTHWLPQLSTRHSWNNTLTAITMHQTLLKQHTDCHNHAQMLLEQHTGCYKLVTFTKHSSRAQSTWKQNSTFWEATYPLSINLPFTTRPPPLVWQAVKENQVFLCLTLTCTGWSTDRVEPMPSTVVTAWPCTPHSGTKHATTARWLQYIHVLCHWIRPAEYFKILS